MASKQMKFDSDARAEIFAGMSQLSRAVRATLGPRGRNVVLQKSYGSPRITKDGVTGNTRMRGIDLANETVH